MPRAPPRTPADTRRLPSKGCRRRAPTPRPSVIASNVECLGLLVSGRWLGGVSLAIAPLCMLAGVVLRIQFHFFFPQQLAAFADHPSLIAVSYGLFLIGNILLWPAIVALARMIGLRRSGWA